MSIYDRERQRKSDTKTPTAAAMSPQKSANRKALVAKIHIAKKDLALTDDSYRAVLYQATNKDSCRDMNISELNQVISVFKKYGWKPKRVIPQKSHNPQVRMVYRLWWMLAEYGVVKSKSRSACQHWFNRTIACTPIEWASVGDLVLAIERLKQWGRRVGNARKDAVMVNDFNMDK